MDRTVPPGMSDTMNSALRETCPTTHFLLVYAAARLDSTGKPASCHAWNPPLSAQTLR
jgi:hypothetical protein